MDDALHELHGLHTVIETNKSTLAKYVVALEYRLDARSHLRANEETSATAALALSQKRRRIETPAGCFTVTVGCSDGWWSVQIKDSALRTLVSSAVHESTIDSHEPNEDRGKRFTDKVLNAFTRHSIMVGVKKSAPADARSWTSIRLYIDVEQDPIQLRLGRLDETVALARSTNIVLHNTRYASTSTAIHQPLSEDVVSDRTSASDLHQLRRKLEASQQALREERHKYRSLLAAPSAANARAGRRPVVGLDPLPQSRSQSIRTMFSQTPSSPSTSSRSTSKLPSSSSAGAAWPSSDDFSAPSPSQRSMSLINPTRVRRADPSENQGFVDDHLDDL